MYFCIGKRADILCLLLRMAHYQFSLIIKDNCIISSETYISPTECTRALILRFLTFFRRIRDWVVFVFVAF